MKNDHRYYVYLFWRKDKMEVFYIGKGTGLRRFDTKNNRNKYFKRICDKTEVFSTVYESYLNENEAFELEKELISDFRSKGLAYTNFHEGGRGGDVYKYDGEKRKELMKKKCRAASLGDKNPMYKKSWHEFSTPERIEKHKQNISKGLIEKYKDESHRKKTSLASIKMWNREGFKEKYRKNNSRRVHMYDKDMNYLRTFTMLWEALEFLGLKSHTTLLKSIRLNKMYKGYYWRREELKGVTTIENPSKEVELVE